MVAVGMTLPPQWFEQANQIIASAAKARNKIIRHSMQSNMVGYDRKWNPVLAGMFGNSVGSSVDFPNLHRKVLGGRVEDFNALWSRKVREAREAGINVQVISIPNQETLAIGAERFYAYLVDELQISDFQVNTPFPGGELNDPLHGFLLATDRLSHFLIDLLEVWLERGYSQGVRIGPFDGLIDYFITGNGCLPCIWRENCAKEFVCIDALGNVSQCDCWVTSYPEFWFGNLFEADSLSELLRTSPARRRFQERPSVLIQQEDCLHCDYLALCHGGCPIRTYTVQGTLLAKDPYCQLYQSLFREVEGVAARLAGSRAVLR
jgi:radical SAM protein with 4Fe4S-binding SPASM domain